MGVSWAIEVGVASSGRSTSNKCVVLLALRVGVAMELRYESSSKVCRLGYVYKWVWLVVGIKL